MIICNKKKIIKTWGPQLKRRIIEFDSPPVENIYVPQSGPITCHMQCYTRILYPSLPSLTKRLCKVKGCNSSALFEKMGKIISF